MRANDDATTRSQFLPWMSLDQTTGNLAFTFHDARLDGGNGPPGDTNGVVNDDAWYWAAVSRDGGQTWRNVPFSRGASNDDQAANGIDYGDYTGCSFYGGVLHGVWADNSNSTGDNPDGTLNQFDLYSNKVTVP